MYKYNNCFSRVPHFLVDRVEERPMVGDVKFRGHLGRQFFVIFRFLLVEDVTLDNEVIVFLITQQVDDVQEIQA